MSETETQPPPDEAPPVAPSEGQETPPESTPEDARFRELEEKFERRTRQLTARIGNLARERDEAMARAAQAQAPPQHPIDPQVQAAIQQQAAQLAHQERTQEKVRSFHQAGAEAYPDWRERCDDLQAMGADAQLAELLVDLPDGHKIAASLRDAPDELERIASLRGERTRAIALGQYVARLEAQPVKAVSKAPPPPKPVTGRVAPQPGGPNWSADDWANYYSKQDLERRGLINRR